MKSTLDTDTLYTLIKYTEGMSHYKKENRELITALYDELQEDYKKCLSNRLYKQYYIKSLSKEENIFEIKHKVLIFDLVEKKGKYNMNKTILIGRLTKDVDVRYTQNENPLCIARYTLAVDRKIRKDGEQTADFINCVAFGKLGEFAEKYLKKGIKIAVEGRLQTGSYEKDGVKHYTTNVIVESQEFCESKTNNNSSNNLNNNLISDDGFAPIEEGEDSELPF